MTTICNKSINQKFNELRLPFLCYDSVFKAIFTDEVDILAKMVSDITGMDYSLLENNITLEFNELPVNSLKEKSKRCDFILRIDENNILNIELNSSYYVGLLIKNLAYLCNIFSRAVKKSEKYTDDLNVVQINLNCFEKNISKSVLEEYKLQNVKTHETYLENISILTLDIVKCHDIYYNDDNKEKLPEFIKWGAFLYNRDYDEIPNIIGSIMSKREVKKIMSKISKIVDDSLFMSELEKEEWAIWEENSKLAYAKNEGISQGMAQGMAQGIEQNTKELILSMVKNDATLEFISKVTNKTIDEIKEIIKE